MGYRLAKECFTSSVSWRDAAGNSWISYLLKGVKMVGVGVNPNKKISNRIGTHTQCIYCFTSLYEVI